MIFRNSSEITLKFYEKNYEKLGEIQNTDDFMIYVHMCDYLQIPTLLKNMLKFVIDNNIRGNDYKTLHELYAKTSPHLVEQIRCISTIQKNNICDMMVINGYRKSLQYTKEFNMKWTERLTFNAVIYKQFNCFMYLLENDCPCDYDKCLTELIRLKNIVLIKMIYKKCTKSNKSFVSEAAKAGSLEILIFLTSQGYEFNEEAYFKAIENGNLSCVKFFQLKFYREITSKHFSIAINNNRTNVANYFEEVVGPNKLHLEQIQKDQIIQSEQTVEVKTNQSQKENPPKIIVKSESEKSLDLLKETLKINSPKIINQPQYAPKVLSPRPSKNSSAISENELLEVLKTIPEKYNELESIKNMFLSHSNKDKKFTKEAAIYNNYEVLKFLLENGYQFDKSIPEIAAMKGFIKVLDVVIDKKYPLNVQMCNIALKAKQKRCLEYLIEKKCPGHELFIKPLADMQ